MEKKTKMLLLASSIVASAGATAGLEVASMGSSFKKLAEGNKLNLKKRSEMERKRAALIKKLKNSRGRLSDNLPMN